MQNPERGSHKYAQLNLYKGTTTQWKKTVG